ncbi:hypothetical protein F5Y19DRAFT_351132 [Xylariaceae sp. FL1651]|nr:hypothetical protein F5Y19DRAFT_351132 [Xylariaceae sp. FL1651]
MGCPADIAIAISSKKARYGRYLDTKQWDKFASEVLLPDCKWRMCNQQGELLVNNGVTLAWDSTADYIAYFSKLLATFDCVHMFGVGDFEQVDADTVKATFLVEDQLVSKPLGQWVELRGGGYIFETWKLRDGEWYLQDLLLKRHYQNMSMIVRFAVFLQTKLGISLM